MASFLEEIAALPETVRERPTSGEPADSSSSPAKTSCSLCNGERSVGLVQAVWSELEAAWYPFELEIECPGCALASLQAER